MSCRRVKTSLVLRSRDDNECIVCGDATIGFLHCCGCSVCVECLAKWADESNKCPHCQKQIHTGEDKRYRNIDNPAPGAPASFLLERILHFITNRRRVMTFQIALVRTLLTTSSDDYYPVNAPAVIRIPGPAGVGDSVYTFDLSHAPEVNLRVQEAQGIIGEDFDDNDDDDVWVPGLGPTPASTIPAALRPHLSSPRPNAFTTSRQTQTKLYQAFALGVLVGFLIFSLVRFSWV